MKSKNLRILSILSIFYILALFSCDIKNEILVNNKKLIVGTSADNPPYEYITGGQIVGFDIDLINAIAQEIGHVIEVKNMDFFSLIPSLVTKKIDAVIAGISITSERAKIVEFSIPYINSNPVIIYNRKTYPKFQYVNIENKKIAAQIGTTFVEIGKQLSEKYNSHLIQIENNLITIKDLLSEKTDFLILEEFQAKQFAKLHPELNFEKLTTNFQTSFAIAIPKNSDIKEKIDNAISKLQKSGELDNLAKKWNVY